MIGGGFGERQLDSEDMRRESFIDVTDAGFATGLVR